MTRIPFPAPGSDAYKDAKARGAQNPLQPGEFRGGPPDEFGDGASEAEAVMPPAVRHAVESGTDDALGKALGIIHEGMPFVIVGMRPTAGGCDFVSSVVGSPAVVGPAAPHLAEMVARCLKRNGYNP